RKGGGRRVAGREPPLSLHFYVSDCILMPSLGGAALVALPLLPSCFISYFGLNDAAGNTQLLASLVLALFGYLATLLLVPQFSPFLAKRGLTGKDLCKKGQPGADKPVPEAAGVIPGTTFIICIIFLQLFYGNTVEKMIDYHSALLSICFMVFLGFTDDVLDLPWRYKLLLPTVATLPLLCAYDGSTSVVLPPALGPLLFSSSAYLPNTTTSSTTLLGTLLSYVMDLTPPLLLGQGTVLVDLGLLYMVYMGMLAVFCTNAVNIYAGINGLEAGQSFIISCAIITHNLVEMSAGRLPGNHLFSAMLMIPFCATTLGLLEHNWYPARAFVGDTYCYFAGMTFAVVGIHGKFSKTLVLMFIPQVINFLFSVPQLFKLVPCPRHRLPRVNPSTCLLEPSTVKCKALSQGWLRSGPEGECINMTLINLVLHMMGPMHERTLCLVLLALQVLGCGFGFWVRYHWAYLAYGGGSEA
ncbi:unnamed protein product, partial [Chrysoparadoxa australica]